MKKITNLIIAYIVTIAILFLALTGLIFLLKLAVDFWLSLGGK